jgi:hypothetical protein
MQPKWQIQASHIVAAILGLGGVGIPFALHFLSKAELSDAVFVLSSLATLAGGLTGLLSPSPTSAGRIAAAAEVPSAVVKVTNAVNDKIRASGRPPPYPLAPPVSRTAITPPEGNPKP